MRTLERVVEDARILIEEKMISADDAASLARSAEYRLSDAMREGSKVTTQASGWGDTDTACALSAAAIALKARHII
jgi:hypothetical protein